MVYHQSHFTRFLIVFLLLAALMIPAAAAEREIHLDQVYYFDDTDFSTSDNAAAPRGILLTSVPDPETGHIFLGNRMLHAGDALPYDSFQQLRFEPACIGEASMEWIPVFSRYPAPASTLVFGIGSGENQPPVTEDSTLETYRNIPIDGRLNVTDSDDDDLLYSVIKEPKRGSVSVNKDGSYVYTPEKNKVGKDSFTVQVADSAGNTAEVTVKVSIIKPSDKATFADLDGDSDQFYAMWLREKGLYEGQTLSGTLLFQPEQKVSRGEFLSMSMNLLNISPAAESLSTGFADEEITPDWLKPYLVTALRSGFISGVSSSGGLCFRHDAAVTEAEAAVMLSHMLGLDAQNAVSVFSSDNVPAWAVQAVSCLSEYGIHDLDEPSHSMTMRETAKLLYQVYKLRMSDQVSFSLLSWAEDA